MKELVELQRRFFNGNATKSVAFRLEQLNKLKTMLSENEDQLQEAIYKDIGKGTFETFLTEFYFIKEEIKTAANNLWEWAQIRPIGTNLLNAPARSYIIPEPLGVSLVISPWNYPFQLSLAPAVAAVAAGCTIVVKPSELTPNCSRLLAKLIGETFDREYFAVVEGGDPQTAELLEQKWDLIFFTGSASVGGVVYEAAAKHLTPVVLELGGKCPAIVTADADLNVAAQRLVWAKFLNSGQSCIAPDYVCVEKSVEKEFLERLKAEIQKADYKLENSNYVKIINSQNTARLAEMLDIDKVYTGGGYDVAKRYFGPTVMYNINWDDAVMRDEICGPILPVMAYIDLDEMIGQIKERPKPLSLSLFTRDENIRRKVLREISFGGGCVNDALMHIANGDLPFGGVGESGTGKYHGEAGFRSFSHFKSILEKELVPDADVKYSPHTDEKLALLRSIVGVD